MFGKKEKESEIVNKFFKGKITIDHINNDGSTQYHLENGEYLLTILVFNDDVAYNTWQLSLRKNKAMIPLEDFEFKLFAKKSKEFIRNNF